jgi:hypothetical protein
MVNFLMSEANLENHHRAPLLDLSFNHSKVTLGAQKFILASLVVF